MRFLETICTLCKAARHKGLSQGLKAFCHRFELAENIKVRGHPVGLGRGGKLPRHRHTVRTVHGQGQACVDAERPQGDSGAAEKPCQQRPQHRGWQGALWGLVLGRGQRVSGSPAAWCWVCWHWVLAAGRPHPSCALQVLLEEEPRDHLHTAVRQQAMLAIAALRYLPSPRFG